MSVDNPRKNLNPFLKIYSDALYSLLAKVNFLFLALFP
jgi:hypothetical protein